MCILNEYILGKLLTLLFQLSLFMPFFTLVKSCNNVIRRNRVVVPNDIEYIKFCIRNIGALIGHVAHSLKDYNCSLYLDYMCNLIMQVFIVQ